MGKPNLPDVRRPGFLLGPGRWIIDCELAGESEGENHRIAEIAGLLARHFQQDPDVSVFSQKLSSELAALTIPAMEYRVERFILDRLLEPAPMLIPLVLVAVITRLSPSATKVSCVAHPVDPVVNMTPECLRALNEANRPQLDLGETASQYAARALENAKRITAALHVPPLKKGRRPRTEKPGRGLPRYVEWWYRHRWCKETQYEIGVEDNPQFWIQIKDTDRLMRLLNPRRLRQIPHTYLTQ
jgi:hypothetical protein